MIAAVAITANGRPLQRSISAPDNPASCGRLIERELTTDKPSGASLSARSSAFQMGGIGKFHESPSGPGRPQGTGERDLQHHLAGAARAASGQ